MHRTPVFRLIIQPTHFNTISRSLSKENINFAGIGAEYVYQIFFDKIFVYITVFFLQDYT